ncbi:MAG: hypothetical protein ABIR57_12105, partial [Aeromicrobium sp.]
MTIEIERTTIADGVVERLRAVYATKRTRPIEWRLEQLNGIERLLAENEPQIAAALEVDLGRNATESWLADIASSVGEVVFARKNLRKWMKKRKQRLPL